MRMRTTASAAAAAAVAVAALLGTAGTAVAHGSGDDGNMLVNRATMAPLFLSSTGSNGDWNSGPMMNPLLMG